MKTTADLWAILEEKINERKAALNGDNLQKIGETRDNLKRAFDEYNSSIKKDAHEAFLAEENPALACIKSGFYSTKKLIDKLDKDGQYDVRVVDGKPRMIDIIYLNKVAGKTIFSNTLMTEVKEVRNLFISYRAAKLDKTVTAMKEGGYTDAKASVSKSQIHKAMQSAFDAILTITGEESGKNSIMAMNRDVEILYCWAFQQSEAFNEKVKNAEWFRNALVLCMWARLNNKDFKTIVGKGIEF